MNDLEEKLGKISLNERRILQCLSIFWEQITAQELHRLLKVLELKTPEGKGYSAQYVSLLRTSLIHNGLLENTTEYWGSGFQLDGEELKEFFTREASRENWFAQTIETIQANFNLDEFSRYSYNSERYKTRLLRDYRLSFYRQNLAKAAELSGKISEVNLTGEAFELTQRIFSNPFQKELLAKFPADFQIDILLGLFARRIENADSTAELWEFARENRLDEEPFQGFAALEFILAGEINRAKEILGEPTTLYRLFSALLIAVLEKDYEKAAAFGDAAIKLWKKVWNKKKGFPENWQMFFYGLALYKTDESRFHSFAEDFSLFCLKNYPAFTAHRAVSALSYFLKNNDNLAQIAVSQMRSDSFLDQFIRIIVTAIAASLKLPNFVKDFERKSQAAGFRWCEMEVANLSASRENQSARAVADKLQNELGFEPLGKIVPPLEGWERALNSLLAVAETVEGKTQTTAKLDETRVAWLLDFEQETIQPVEQKYGKKGWSDGRNIALKRLYERDVKNLTEQDSLIVKISMKRQQDYYYASYSYNFDWEKALSAMVGHPFLFLRKNPSVNIRLEASEPALVIKQIGESLLLSFDVKIAGEGVVIQKETETRYKIVQISKRHVDIAASLPENRLKIPATGREKLLRAISPLAAKVAIESDLEEHLENLPSVAPDERIHALITPAGEGFHLEFFVKPFGKIPPYFKPGKGSESVVADLDGIRTRSKRDVQKERRLLDEIERACPFLAESETPNYEWNLADAESCLTALSEMETPRREGKLAVEWTKGQKLKLLGNINFENLSLSVKGANNWFEVEGKAQVNEDLVLSLKELNGLLSQNTKNFIELSDGQFVAVTEKLRKHLQSLGAILDEKNRLHNLRSGILEEFSDELENFKADKAWRAHLEKIKTARKFVPELPATFEAEFRPYQLDGYEWLSRLANWGVGACLADDMGLGKTLMALALLVERAERGAALVVAPVSVCRNWVKEARRFAPTLNFQLFGENDRKAAVENLGKYDVLVTSYNLLQLEEELFTNKNFATIVLDEAQAIKNRQTKRSKTVMNLQGDFRLITTGTPIENHLGELWNLFNFVNPGLLGSHEFFSEKFAVPIEKNKDEAARKTLQKLLKPFILRRRKNQVLDDLPA